MVHLSYIDGIYFLYYSSFLDGVYFLHDISLLDVIYTANHPYYILLYNKCLGKWLVSGSDDNTVKVTHK